MTREFPTDVTAYCPHAAVTPSPDRLSPSGDTAADIVPAVSAAILISWDRERALDEMRGCEDERDRGLDFTPEQGRMS